MRIAVTHQLIHRCVAMLGADIPADFDVLGHAQQLQVHSGKHHKPSTGAPACTHRTLIVAARPAQAKVGPIAPAEGVLDFLTDVWGAPEPPLEARTSDPAPGLLAGMTWHGLFDFACKPHCLAAHPPSAAPGDARQSAPVPHNKPNPKAATRWTNPARQGAK